MANSKITGSKAATSATKTLMSKATGMNSQSAAGGDLSQKGDRGNRRLHRLKQRLQS
jgi:hypothetical protein